MNKESSHESATSLGVATLRAAHQLLDGHPKVLDDTAIVKLLEPEIIDAIKNTPEIYLKEGSMKLRAHVLLRSRYAEDCLREAFNKGVRQYIILGAGLDTFACRQPAWASPLKIFEVDHPATQHKKRERLKQSGFEMPRNLTFVPVDFESSTLTEELRKSSFDFTQPVFISWLGVTMYLTMEAIDAVFALVAALAKHSEMVFTFAQQKPMNAVWSLAARSAEMGEPWLTYFTLEDLKEKLTAHGFPHISFLTPAEAKQIYFTGRTDGLEPADWVDIVRVVI